MASKKKHTKVNHSDKIRDHILDALKALTLPRAWGSRGDRTTSPSTPAQDVLTRG